jgi:hypothetical protein
VVFLYYPTTFLTCKKTISSCLLATLEVVDRPKSYQVDVLCADYQSHQTITCGYEVLFYLLPLLYSLVENYIILSPCHNRSSGQTQIPSNRCIVRRLPESSSSYMRLQSSFLSYPTTFLTFQRTVSSCLLANVELRRLPKSPNSYMWLRTTFLSYPTTFLTCKRTTSSCLLATVEVVDRPKSYQVDVLCVDYRSHRTITWGYEVLFYIIPLLFLLVRELYHLVSLPR